MYNASGKEYEDRNGILAMAVSIYKLAVNVRDNP